MLSVLALVPVAQAQAPAAKERTSAPTREVQPAQLVRELREGGYLLYFRHAATDMSKNDARMRDYDDCDNQRNLTDPGRDDARAVGAALRALRIPVERVLASPFCRTMETAQLIFGRAEKTGAVRGGPASAEAGRYAELRMLLETSLPRGTNLVVVSHGNPFIAVAGPPYLAEGEAAVVRPLGGRFEVYARMRVEDWKALRAAAMD